MQKNISLALAITLGLGLAGCSNFAQTKQTALEKYQAHFMSVTPTHESVEPVFLEAKQKAFDEPTAENLEAFNYVLGLKRLLGQSIATGDFGLKHKQVNREPTLDWGNDSRGGAVNRQPAYIHTLGGNFNTLRPGDDKPAVTVNVPPEHLKRIKPISVSQSFSSGKGDQALSMYELSRWERYCNAGKGMDKRDWEFVRKEGIDNVPSILAFDCIPPATARRAR